MFRRGVVFFVLAIAVGGCASMQRPSDTAGFRQAEHHSPRYQLGFNDGCEVANENYGQAKLAGGRNDELFKGDPDYREGWMTGREDCKDTVFIVNTGKPNDHLNALF